MWKCQSGSGTYLNYECQEFLKRKFQDKSMSVERMGYLRKAVDILKQNNNILGSYEEILQEISSYVTNSGAFFYADPRLPCNYINYLLNEKLRSKGMHNHTSIYDFFKKFVAEVYKSEKGNYHADKMCDIDIKPLDDDIYDKMTKLYELYNLYDVLKWTLPSRIKSECKPFGKMIRIYNNTIKDLTLQDEELVKKLLTLKEMTSNIPLPESKICYDRIEHFKEPKLYNDLKEKERLRKEQEEAQKAIEKQKQEEKRLEEEQRKQQPEQAAQSSLLAQVTGGALGIPGDDELSGTSTEHLRAQSLNLEFPRGQKHSEGSHFRDPSTPLLVHSMEQTEFYQPGEKYPERDEGGCCHITARQECIKIKRIFFLSVFWRYYSRGCCYF
ncbi:PIR protein, partial [Plasmodium vivax]